MCWEKEVEFKAIDEAIKERVLEERNKRYLKVLQQVDEIVQEIHSLSENINPRTHIKDIEVPKRHPIYDRRFSINGVVYKIYVIETDDTKYDNIYRLCLGLRSDQGDCCILFGENVEGVIRFNKVELHDIGQRLKGV